MDINVTLAKGIKTDKNYDVYQKEGQYRGSLTDRSQLSLKLNQDDNRHDERVLTTIPLRPTQNH